MSSLGRDTDGLRPRGTQPRHPHLCRDTPGRARGGGRGSRGQEGSGGAGAVPYASATAYAATAAPAKECGRAARSLQHETIRARSATRTKAPTPAFAAECAAVRTLALRRLRSSADLLLGYQALAGANVAWMIACQAMDSSESTMSPLTLGAAIDRSGLVSAPVSFGTVNPCPLVRCRFAGRRARLICPRLPRGGRRCVGTWDRGALGWASACSASQVVDGAEVVAIAIA